MKFIQIAIIGNLKVSLLAYFFDQFFSMKLSLLFELFKSKFRFPGLFTPFDDSFISGFFLCGDKNHFKSRDPLQDLDLWPTTNSFNHNKPIFLFLGVPQKSFCEKIIPKAT